MTSDTSASTTFAVEPAGAAPLICASAATVAATSETAFYGAEAQEEGVLGGSHDVAIKAYREGKLPFPDGTIIARLAWDYVPLEESGKAFGRLQSFVAGPPKNGVQFMVKDASTGGWGFAHFNDDKPVDEAVYNTCFSCHAIVDQCGLSRLMHGEMPCSYGFDA